ncbi:acyl-CoA dehydrogenase family protein [Glutamicibacter soli]|uniref:Acyl-CoA dehydrogenase n=1 Tax=Glutamicibacter soli TaxID=453836 RepID=A0A365Y7A9_9MICC|nr:MULTISPECIES: acyl-CoA dehydrogenase family protein [Micrococcaceae]ALD64791.1 acyl-CoA dehydrogenase [Arthrobacter sp. LS16]NAZ15137.1 acyl-CoA dehydrogenase [Glutamicibacter soli]RBL98550.1 acyl-CoA dehydrogenase [Glutamicibacter soli]RKS15961.1 glutaryl-CoA dehydrogenase [Arthrobacter sp. AG1021]
MTQQQTGFAFPSGVTEPQYDLWSDGVNIDPTGIFSELSEADAAWRAKARKFVLDEVKDDIHEYWDKADYPLHLVKKLGDADLLRDGLAIEGRQEMSPLAAGLINMEMARGDGSVATIIGVQGGLALRSVIYCGSPEQIAKYGMPMLAGELPGAFALTEPTHGSDSVSLETAARKVEGGYALSGEKKWIGNGSIGGVSIVWARDEEGKVRGFIVHQEAEGYQAANIENKLSLRAIWQAHIRMDEVFVPDEDVLPEAKSFKDTSRVLFATRLGVAWAAVGHATACYESAVNYAKQRIQFGRPLAASQIVQERLARMQSELATIQLLVMQATKREASGELTGPQASLAKYTATRTARSIASNARDLLGGNGILTSNRVARHFADVEAIHTYEGTETVQALIMGRDITGISAFA